ncbi:MAG: hypothetical protein ACRDP8_12305 [Actinopolymorphaceae bacterium]
MTPTAEQPVQGEFCMRCGPDTGLHPYGDGSLLRCACCGWERVVPRRPLFVVTGPSGVGRTTIMPALARSLTGCEVFDVDLTLHVAALGGDVWLNTWLQLAHGIALNGRSTVLCGSLMPDYLEELPARRLVGPIHFCLLDAPDEVLVERLRARPEWRGGDGEFVARRLKFAAWLRNHIQPSFSSFGCEPAIVADRVADWITSSLD